jgi:hypothetical protein
VFVAADRFAEFVGQMNKAIEAMPAHDRLKSSSEEAEKLRWREAVFKSLVRFGGRRRIVMRGIPVKRPAGAMALAGASR